MNRLSQRVSNALVGVRCPGCGNFVVPRAASPPAGAESGASAPGKRWSFVWRPPSGPVCPECEFPLERYTRRLKWIRLMVTGIVLVTLSVLLLVLGMMGGGVGWGQLLQRVLGVTGAVAFLVGFLGIVIGGRSTTQ